MKRFKKGTIKVAMHSKEYKSNPIPEHIKWVEADAKILGTFAIHKSIPNELGLTQKDWTLTHTLSGFMIKMFRTEKKAKEMTFELSDLSDINPDAQWDFDDPSGLSTALIKAIAPILLKYNSYKF